MRQYANNNQATVSSPFSSTREGETANPRDSGLKKRIRASVSTVSFKKKRGTSVSVNRKDPSAKGNGNVNPSGGENERTNRVAETV